MAALSALSAPQQPGRRARARLSRAAVAAVAAGTLLLSGCAQGPGNAAVVDGRVISEREVQRTAADLRQLLPNPLGASDVLVALVVGPYFVDAAAENGVGVSDDQARSLAGQIATGQGREVGDLELGQGTLDLLKFTLATERLQQLPDGGEVLRTVEDEVFSADIDVSPRYGELSETGQIVRPELPWMAPPTPTS